MRPPRAPRCAASRASSTRDWKAFPGAEVLEVPADFYATMGLETVVSPLRLRGMGAILARLKRQIRDQVDAAT